MELTLNNQKQPTLCLNMIVKNESKIIRRLFDSVLPIIDCYCICDTGSTDDTVQIITEYFNNKNPTLENTNSRLDCSGGVWQLEGKKKYMYQI